MCVEYIEKLAETERKVAVITTAMNKVATEMVGSRIYNSTELRGVLSGLEEVWFDLKNYVDIVKVKME